MKAELSPFACNAPTDLTAYTPLLRTVRMTFAPEKAAEFLAIFEESSPKIRAFPGCQRLELWQDDSQENVFMTFSHWESAEALEAYRRSELFQSTWARTKPLFSAKPTAFSARRLLRVAPGQ